MVTPKYLTCPCGYPLSEKTDAAGHIFYCMRCSTATPDKRATVGSPTAATLNRGELDRLAQYNAECARGIVHTAEWDRQMAALQTRFSGQRDG